MFNVAGIGRLSGELAQGSGSGSGRDAGWMGLGGRSREEQKDTRGKRDVSICPEMKEEGRRKDKGTRSVPHGCVGKDKRGNEREQETSVVERNQSSRWAWRVECGVRERRREVQGPRPTVQDPSCNEQLSNCQVNPQARQREVAEQGRPEAGE